MNTDSPLPGLLPQLIDSLREELSHYAAMLELLDRQQSHVIARSPEEVVNSVATIKQQMTLIQTARAQREDRQREVARALEKPGEPAFANLIPLLPQSHRGAVQALVNENNTLLHRVRQRARQSHLLLLRSLELMQRFLNHLLPTPGPATPDEAGRIERAGSMAKPLYEALG